MLHYETKTIRRSILAALSLVGMWLAGCQPTGPAGSVPDSAAPQSAAPQPPLRVLIIGDPELAKVIKREWEARSEGELALQELAEEEVHNRERRRLGADAVIYPSPLLGELAARVWLAPLPKDQLRDPAYQYPDILAATRTQELMWQDDTTAVPLGGPPLLLFYRLDVFEHLSLTPPRTWLEYRELGERLANRQSVRQFLSSEDARWSGVCEPLEGVWAAQMLLARAAAYAKHRSQFSALFDSRSMKPLIDGPPFVRALGELAEAAKFGPPVSERLTPADTVQRLRDGQAGMAIGYLVETADWGTNEKPDSEKRPESPPKIGVLPLPGSPDVHNFRSNSWEQRIAGESSHIPLVGITGRLGSLTQECRQPQVALRMLLWLSGPEMSAKISSASSATAPFRQAHLSQIDHWTGRLVSQNLVSQETVHQYAEAVQQSLSEPNCLIGLRIPGRQQYLQSLADGVRKTLVEGVAADAALREVARQWQSISESLGIESQRQAYAQSVGLHP